MSNIFVGELMTCIMCRRSERSRPDVESNWRMLDVEGSRYYVCPAEFPPDDSPAEDFEIAYKLIMAQIMIERLPAGERAALQEKLNEVRNG